MKTDAEFYQLLDDDHKGVLSEEALRQFRERMDNDVEFRKEADAYLLVMNTLKAYGDRSETKKSLDKIHEEMLATDTVVQIPSTQAGSRKSWWGYAVAACVAAAIATGGLLMTRSLETKQKAYYKELRKNVEQIRKSQKQIMEDLAETKGNAIVPGRYSGTGFLISSNGYVATSYHVVRESDSVSIENETYGRLKATVIYNDALNDISILKITSPDFKPKKILPYTISNQESDLGEYVYTLGFPREDIVFGEGSVSAATGFGQNPNAYQISVPVNPGNSGGPLLNSNGDLVGIVSGVQTETAGAAFAIKSGRLLDVVNNEGIDSLSSPLTFPKQNTIRNLQRPAQIKKWREFVFLVRVYKDK